jgi:hypothetical protein
LRIVESVGALLACGAAGALGFFAGGRWAPGPVLGAIMGVPLGAVFAAVYFALALWVGETWPDLLDARLVGLISAALVIAGAACGAIGAVFGYRKSLGASLF